MESVATSNRRKYLKAPTYEMILDVVRELGVSCKQFERYFGMPNGTLGLVSFGDRDLPAKFWHIIYEKDIPKRGVNFEREMSRYIEAIVGVKAKKKDKKIKEKKKPILQVSSRLAGLI